MSRVFIVTSGCYSDYRYNGVFSTRKKAEQFMENCKASEECWNKDFNDIDEVVIDAELAQTEYTRWLCGVMLDTGEMKEKVYEQRCFGIPEAKTYIAESVPCYGGRGIARAESHKSAEHAKKLAVEARQEWLRKTAQVKGGE